MENIELTNEEKRELEKRGFLVKDYFGFGQLLKNIVPYIGILILIYPIINSEGLNTLAFIYYSIIPLILTGLFSKTYIFIGKLFITPNGIYVFGKDFIPREFKKDYTLLTRLNTWINKDTIKKHNSKNDWGSSLFKKIVLFSIILLTFIYFISITNFYIGILCGLLVYSMPLVLLYLSRQLVEHFHPLYAFGNLGEKIQKLTPQIAEKSKEIQKNFASDMSFWVLSDGFDGLASTFSQIVSLVIRLEKVEARANRGNLFDSEKYISSLRSDIVGPLRSLRSFLDDKRTQLTASHEELSRVRVQVGGASEQRDLASARTEPLTRELTENIDQLDVMIEKMG